ncbi:MAG: DUF6491 family protein [Rhodocyclaceae bacterium]
MNRLPLSSALARLAACGLAAALLAAASGSLAAKGPVVPHGAVRVSKVFGWRPLDHDHLIIWLGVSEPYAVSVAPACPPAVFDAPQWMSIHDGHLVPNVDHIGNGEDSCRITHIAPIPRAQRATLGLTTPAGTQLVLKRHYARRP